MLFVLTVLNRLVYILIILLIILFHEHEDKLQETVTSDFTS